MPYYSTANEVLQEIITPGTGERLYVSPATGEVAERLNDPKFDWRQKKRDAARLAAVYEEAGKTAPALADKADKAAGCSSWLEYLASGDLTRRQLHRMNACHMRLCPVCSARRAHTMAVRLERILARVEQEHPGVQFVFLTLTMQNVPGDGLRAALDELTDAWSKLRRRRPVQRAACGWFRAIEITRNRAADTYHPHIHAILAVEPDYFDRHKGGKYITQAAWVSMWQQSLRVAYKPIVDVRATHTRGRKGGGTDTATRAASLEAAKYATKSCEYLSAALPLAEAAKVAEVYTVALHRKRMTALGGWLAEAADALAVDLEAEGDLVHDEDGAGELTEATAELVESYRFNASVRDYVLGDRRPNPAYQGPATAEDGESCQGSGVKGTVE